MMTVQAAHALVGVLLLAALAAGLPDGPAVGLAATVNDADGDGCSDGEELGPNQALGGRRDPTNFWDFFDAPNPNATPQKDKVIAVDDIVRVVARFGTTGDPTMDPRSKPPKVGYHPAYDRSSPPPGGDAWDLGPANGSISIGDIVAAVIQFGHTCTRPEVAGSWSSGAAMPTPRTEVTSALLDGVIYVIGGFRAVGGNSDVAEAYDTATDSWSTKAPLPQRLDHAGAAAVGGKVYLVGGYISLGQGLISSATYEYDPIANAWTTRAAMPLPRAAAATVVVDGVIYVLGGVGPQPTVPLAYDPAANSWRTLAPMSAAREHLTAAVVDGRIYVIGGRQNVIQNVGTVEGYHPATNSWQTLPSLPTARGGLASGALAGRVHVVGGEDLTPGGTTFPQHEVYHPASSSWQPGPPLPTARHGLTAQVVGGRLYVIAGGPTPGLSVSGVVEIFQPK